MSKLPAKFQEQHRLQFFVEKNPLPTAAIFEFMAGTEPYVNIRIKMLQTSMVRVAVKAGGKTYMVNKEVKVTLGGCGG